MRNAVRTMLSLAALAAMLSGMLGQARTAVEASPIDRQAQADLAQIGALTATEEAPPRWAYAGATFTRLSINPDSVNPLGKAIEVSVKTQQLTAWDDGKIVMQFPISTARPGYHTPHGHFNVILKAHTYWSRQWSVWMPEALLFHGSYFIHGLPYKHNPAYRIGAARLGRADSHGCVRVGVADSSRIYDWASVGTPVWVH